jgi:hypothetical protein
MVSDMQYVGEGDPQGINATYLALHQLLNLDSNLNCPAKQDADL